MEVRCLAIGDGREPAICDKLDALWPERPRAPVGITSLLATAFTAAPILSGLHHGVSLRPLAA